MARCSITPESLPIEYSITGFLNSATTSRMISIDSASSRLRCLGSVLVATVEGTFIIGQGLAMIG